MPTNMEYKDFGEEMLDGVLSWVSSNMAIGELFTRDEVRDFCRQNMCVDEVFTDREIREYAQQEFTVAQIFGYDELRKWAEVNGYHHDSDCPVPKEIFFNILNGKGVSIIDSGDDE